MKSEKLQNATKEEVLDVLKQTEQKLFEATRNLGNPLYGISSSNTFAIDDLREELFDFLEVPQEFNKQ